MVVNYHSPITMAEVVKCPPFHNFPVEEGEHKHVWKIKEITFGR